MENKQLVDNLAQKINSSSEEVSFMIESLVDVIKESACNLDSVSFPGFGCFEPKKKLERIAVNPGNGKKLLIPPKITLNFRPSVMLRQRVRNIIDKSL